MIKNVKIIMQFNENAQLFPPDPLPGSAAGYRWGSVSQTPMTNLFPLCLQPLWAGDVT